jgi:hypothetical protein
LCKCFGEAKLEDWDFDYSMLPSHFSQGNIKILYRDKIRVFYSTVAAAKQDGFTDFNPKLFSRPNGYLYSYTGLRGDAKALYKKIRSGAEKRIQLIQTPTVED